MLSVKCLNVFYGDAQALFKSRSLGGYPVMASSDVMARSTLEAFRFFTTSIILSELPLRSPTVKLICNTDIFICINLLV